MVDVKATVKQICLPTTTLRKNKNIPYKKDTVEGDFSALCRTCANSASFMTPIFSGDGLENNLPDLILKYLPIEVSESDELPQSLCYECAHTLLAWHALVTRCRQANFRLRKTAKQRKLEHSSHKVDSKDYKWIESSIELIVKEVLTDYTLIQERKQVCLQYVCQKCPDKSKSVDYLAAHIKDIHLPEIDSDSVLKDFVRENITFEETLEDVGNDSLESLVKEDRDFENSATEFVEGFEQEHIEQMIKEKENTEKVFTDTLEHFKHEPNEKKIVTVYIKEGDTEISKNIEPLIKSRVPCSLHCPFCSSMFSTMARLHHHMSQHPDINEKEGIVCCGQDYCNKTEYLVHYQEKHVTFKSKMNSKVCRTCGFGANSTEELKTHIASAHKSFCKEDKPRRRKRGNATDRPKVIVSCPQCRKLLHKDSLRHHLKIHFEKEREVFACDKCDKKYTVKGNLTFHRRVAHEGMLRYVCAGCGEQFAARAQRDRHQRTHDPPAPPAPAAAPRYACHHCGKPYADKRGVRRHLLSAHAARQQHACALCPSAFHQPQRLRRHLLLKHGVESA